ncbi:MAG: nicotinate-nucleotide--dimethylbenzimidazole phosphoribosyltransferase [Cycloclasticus sp.]|nr:nicotinate-nucleotide--dimethylbenzimidazole phosphoribosyltransferase [Cycloclasticus sp.]
MPAAKLDISARQAAEARQASLTKPVGALGRLEEAVIRLAAMQGTKSPRLDLLAIVIFAADHGVASQGVSAFSQQVTAEMIKNFSRGGAAINVLARELGAQLEVINMGTVNELEALAGVRHIPLGLGTANFCQQAAMDEPQLAAALLTGKESVERAKLAGIELFIAGEMGIGNTTSAAALACALLDELPEELVGLGTGVDKPGWLHKVNIVREALARHRQKLGEPLEILRRLGGFEIAALTGSYIACAQMAMPVLVDGFISSVAALIATRLCPGIEQWLLFSHTSAERGHRRVLEAMQARPFLDLGMRLGEGSGAAVTVPILRMACALHNQMARFDEVSVSEKIR